MSAPKQFLSLTSRAQLDLDNILVYSEQVGGDEQAERYMQAIDSVFEMLQTYPGMGRRADTVGLGIRVQPVGRHIIFYRVTQDVVEILRILHGRADPEMKINT